MPFYWRLKSAKKKQNIVPDSLPFDISYDPHLRLITQKRNAVTVKSLDTIYRKTPNIGNIQEQNIWSAAYKDDFLKFIRKHLSSARHNIKILEIGCGGCLILKELKDSGFDVQGIDPSSFSVASGKKLGVKVIKDFFPSPKVQGKFDLILHSDVLEHMQKPLVFLKGTHRQLFPKGLLIFAIPDSGPNLKNGDMSIFLHQHFNYFDRESLRLILKMAGFESTVIERARYGGSLYASAVRGTRERDVRPDKKWVKYNRFIQNANKLASRIKREIDLIMSKKKKSVGFYAPVRVLPYLGSWRMQEGFRFFDDTPHWHGKYFDGIDVPVENFEDLKERPVTDIFVMSPTFGDVIQRKILSAFGKRIRIKKITDYFRP